MYKLFNLIFVSIILFWVGGEVYFIFTKPAHPDRDDQIHQALERSVNAFDREQAVFLRSTRKMADQLRSVLRESPESAGTLGAILGSGSGFWGSSLYRDGELYVWNGHPVIWNPARYHQEVYTTIQRAGNATYFIVQVEIYTDLHLFHLVNTTLIQRDNQALNYLIEDYDITSRWTKGTTLPIEFSFLAGQPDPQLRYIRYLNTGNVDSVGAVILRAPNLEVMTVAWQDDLRQFRYAIFSVILLSLFILYFTWSQQFSPWARTGLNIFGVVILWITLYILSVPHRWILPSDPSMMSGTAITEPLLNLLISVVFYGLITLIVLTRILPLKRLYGIYWLPRTIGFGILYGAFTGFILPYTVYMIFSTIKQSNINILDLNVIPDLDTWLFYHAAGLLMAAIVVFSLGTGWFLMNTEKNYLGWFRPLVLISFFVSYFLTRFILLNSAWAIELDIWLTLIIVLAFSYTYHLHKNQNALRFTSHLRIVSWVTIISVVILFPFLIHAVTLRQDAEMEIAGTNYINISDDTAEHITTVLLASLSGDDSVIDFATGSRLTPSVIRQRINSLTEPEWLGYAIAGFLVDKSGNVIDGYTSRSHLSELYQSALSTESLNYTRKLAADTAGISLQVEADPTIYDFPIFYKGAARLDLENGLDVAWIVIYVFVERSIYGRPINDALASHYRDRILLQNRFYVAEYKNGEFNRAIESESAFPYPRYRKLNENDRRLLSQDGRIVRDLKTAGTNYREVILKFDEQTDVLVNAPRPNFQNHAFSFFRIFFSVLFTALLLFVIYQVAVNRQLRLFRTSERFQNRILDSYLLATLGFLFVLVITTEYIVSQQNISMVEQELMEDIELIKMELDETGSELTEGILDMVTSRLNLDAFIYHDKLLTMSTAPELFRQQLLPYYLPYPVYDKIYRQNRTTTFQKTFIGSTPLLVSYSVLDGGNPGIIAVPAYTSSARFEEQLLQTTSFLIAIYIFIFGFFIAGAVLISRQLSKPLAEFRSGLQRISSGHLDTIIPVTTQDEIGELANAYNVMVYKLKDLQSELVEVERQAAWTEMARHVAHEIKNPLTPMKLSIQHLQRQVATGTQTIDELRPLINKISQTLIEQMESLNNIATDFSRYAKPLSGKFEDGNLNDVIAATVQLYQHDSKIDINCFFSQESLIINCVPDELKRVFINLIKNSAESMPGGGTIVLQTTRHDGRAYAEVIDNGTGIPPENQSRIFTPNFSSKTSGTGLGLAISKKIVEAHSGDIGFASAPGTGTTFTLSFPLVQKNQVNKRSETVS